MKAALPEDRDAPLDDGYIGQLWAADACARRDDVRRGAVTTISGQEALAQVRKSVARGD